MTAPLQAAFADAMNRIGSFEPYSRVAVGVSGGSDSLALSLLLKGWVEARKGSLLALTVDHGLRHDAAAEARQVGVWLTARGIAHEILTWEGAKPNSGIQAAARDARYRLLTEYCRTHGILHLALAHHREDQAETVLFRFAKGSGVDGLAGMAAVREAGAVRLLRPLLEFPRERLAGMLTESGQPWIDDPSNRSPAYARVRLRQMADALAGEGWSPQRAADTARRAGRARGALETASAALLAQAAEVWPEGCLLLQPDLLLDVAEDIALRSLGRCLAMVGGEPYVPRLEAVERLYRTLLDSTLGKGRTLGGCRIIPYRDGRLLIAREPEAAVDRIVLAGGASVLWDGRFSVAATETGHRKAGQGLVVRLGDRKKASFPALKNLPAVVRAGLPVLLREDDRIDVPNFTFVSEFSDRKDESDNPPVIARFTPREPLTAPAFSVV